MRYVEAVLKRENEAFAYRIYVSDSLYAISLNREMTKRFYDMLRREPEDTRSADEIVSDVMEKGGLVLE